MTFSQRLLNWYRRNRRDLPWRVRPANPYHVLVSEFMLQQTQVATVIPYFHRFTAAFPTIADLAAVPLQQVLWFWQGLGYYSRARTLHATAKRIVAEHGGVIPADAAALRSLPGVGRYTAGAVASIAFGKREPILDGNVTRVLCRLDGIQTDPHTTKTQRMLWARAAQILPRRSPGDFNSALMELGATVCTPRQARCDDCPVREDCRAHAAGLQDKIPPTRAQRPKPLVQRWTFAISRRGRWFIEQRPPVGRWGGLWQFTTVEAPNLERAVAQLGLRVRDVHPLGEIKHPLTHRRYVFIVHSCRAMEWESKRPGKWVTLAELGRHPVAKPHALVAGLLPG
jgi:A/G-specific adenine glycosylase